MPVWVSKNCPSFSPWNHIKTMSEGVIAEAVLKCGCLPYTLALNGVALNIGAFAAITHELNYETQHISRWNRYQMKACNLMNAFPMI